MDSFIKSRLAELDELYCFEIEEAHADWEAAREQSLEAVDAEICAEEADRPFRRADRPEQLSWHCPSPTWRRTDLDAAASRFLKIQEAAAVVRDFRQRELEAQERYTQLFATLAVSKFIWEMVHEHREAMTSSWRKLVRASRFGQIDVSRFEPVWGEFVRDVISPGTRDMSNEHGQAAQDAVETALMGEVGLVYEHLAEAVQGQPGLIGFHEGITPRDYERLCAQLLQDAGWDAETTAGSGDQGVDVLAYRGGTRLVLQCKLYNKPVGNKAVQEAVAARGHERAHAAAVVSNAGFTRAAEELAQTNGIALLHHTEVGRWASGVVNGEHAVRNTKPLRFSE